MRRLYYPENPLEIFPLQFLNSYDAVVELSRELATIVMLLTVAMLAESSSLTRRFAAFVLMFGVWDVFYYVWLKVLIDWPQSWTEWDVLFLIPIVWLGPWICPVMISLLFIVWGSLVLVSPARSAFTKHSLTAFLIGAILGLAAFFQPAIAVLRAGGEAALRDYRPGEFWWSLFIPSMLLMSYGLGRSLPRQELSR